MKKHVYSFGDGTADGDGKMKEVLGGKGAGLAEMSPRAACPCRPASPSPPKSAISISRTTTQVPEEIEEQMLQALAQARRSACGKKLGDAADPLLLSVRSGAKFSMPGMMNTILNLGLNDETIEGARSQERQSALRLRLLPPLHPDVRRSGARHRHARIRRSLRRAQEQDQGQARYRPHRRRSEGRHRRLQEARQEENRQAVSRRMPREQLQCRPRRRVPFLVERPRRSTTARWKRFPMSSAPPPTCRPWCSATWARLLHRRRLHAQSRHRRESFLRRVSGQRAGRRRGGRHPHAAAHLRAQELECRCLQPASRNHHQPGKALQRHAGFRVHHRRTASSTCCRRATASAPARRLYASRWRWWKKV